MLLNHVSLLLSFLHSTFPNPIYRLTMSRSSISLNHHFFHRTIRPGTGTVFRVPDYDDVSGDLTPSKTPLPKQRLTYSPAANGGPGRAGTVTPESGRNGATPGSAGRTPQSERRVARAVSRAGVVRFWTPIVIL
jgi:hypothetical protein